MPDFPIYVYFLFVSALISLSAYFTRRFPELFLRIFPAFLCITFTVEYIGNDMYERGIPNVHLYNYFTAFEFSFYLFIIRLMVESRLMKRILLWLLTGYGIVSFVYIYFFLKPMNFHTVTYSLGCLLVVIGSIFFFYELFQRPKSVKLIRSPAFWICSGLLFFYCSTFPLYTLVSYWQQGISPIILENFGAIISILNVFLYSLFSIAYLCRMTSRKYIL